MVSATEIKFMTYNVWSREDVAVYRRMQAIGDLVRQHQPDVIFFQEVTEHIRAIFASFDWWKDYNVRQAEPDYYMRSCFCLLLSKLPRDQNGSGSLRGNKAGRSYIMARVKPGDGLEPIHVATAHLESRAPPAAARCSERSAQARQLVGALDGKRNAVFGGDTGWDDDVDRPFPLPGGWVDAWAAAAAADDRRSGWTYDAVWEEEAAVFNGYAAPRSSLRRRSDRFVCKLTDYSIEGVEVIGGDGLGIRYEKKGETGDWIDLMPSCHRGLVLTVVPK